MPPITRRLVIQSTLWTALAGSVAAILLVGVPMIVTRTTAAETPIASAAPVKSSPRGDLRFPVQASAIWSKMQMLKVEPETKRPPAYRAPPSMIVIGKCYDTLDGALTSRSEIPVTIDEKECFKPKTGQWTDRFTGEKIYNRDDVRLVPTVSLTEAIGSGGSWWNSYNARVYANDMTDPAYVMIVSEETAKKLNSATTLVLPDNPERQCQYAADWVASKARYDLSIDANEKKVLVDTLTSCINSKLISS